MVDFNPWLLMIVIILLLCFIYKSMRNLYTTFDRLGIPGPRPVWIFGNVLDFKDRAVLSVFKEWKNKFGKVYGFYEGFRPGIVINDPEFAKEILVTRFGLFHCRTNYRPFQYNPTNLQVNLETDFDTWKSQRGVTDKVLNFTGNMKQVMQKIQASSQNLIKRIEQSIKSSTNSIDICGPTLKFTSEAILRLLFDFTEEEMNEYQEMFYDYVTKSTYSSSTENEIAGLARLFPSLTPILQLADGDHRKSHDVILKLMKSHVQKRMKSQKEKTLEDGVSILSNLLSVKMLSRDIDGSGTRRSLVEDEIISHLLMFLSETYNTTAAMIQFILYELACNTEIQDKLYEEIVDVCGTTGELDYRDLKSLHYFDMVSNEAYRLHPIAPGLARVAACDCSLNGYQFKQGMPIRLMTCTMYEDENIFPEPQKFKPERFSQENQDTRHPCTFLPFGMGPRTCPGVKLANIIVKSTIVSLLRQYHLNTNEKTQIPLRHALRPSICPADGVHVTLSHRHSETF